MARHHKKRKNTVVQAYTMLNPVSSHSKAGMIKKKTMKTKPETLEM